MPADVIRVENLVKKFGAITAVDGIQLDVQAGQIFGLPGSEWSGKIDDHQDPRHPPEANSGTASVAALTF